MRRKESKIPLVIAAVLFAWMIFWAFGYVKAHQTAPAPAPVAPERVVNVAPPPQPVQTAPTPQPTATQEPQTIATYQAPTYQSTPDQVDEDGDRVYQPPAGQPVNRKMAAITNEAIKKH